MFKEFYGEFYRILDACADSAYQALFSAYEKEPGVEAKTFHNPCADILHIKITLASNWKEGGQKFGGLRGHKLV